MGELESGANKSNEENMLTMTPIKSDYFIIAAGTIGTDEGDCELTVRLNPEISSINDTSIETPGPPIATSSNAVHDGGNE